MVAKAGTLAEVKDHMLRTPRSYKVGVKTKGSEIFAFNALRFYDRSDAIAYASALQKRWHDVTAYDIFESTDHPNCTYPVPSDRYMVKRHD